MRVLLLHCDYLEFTVQKKAIKEPEQVEDKLGRLEECIVCFMAVEKVDEGDPGYVVSELVKVISELASQVKVENIVVYPYAHLSSELSNLDTAQKVLNNVYTKVSEKYNALKAPFGWYKSFELKCKGHPLSELSRTIVPGQLKEDSGESDALSKEDKLESEWYIMTPDGKLHDISEFDYSLHENLKKFSFYEKAKDRTVSKAPPHIELMRRLELVDYEPGSDPGNLRYYPKGRMIKALLEQYVTDRILEYGGVEVETPLMYDFEHPTLSKYLNRFPARQYTIESDNKRYFLRFAACFGQFLMAHDAIISYKNLPLRLYELARYAFRREKSGELTGLRRLRAFTMPDVHALCTDVTQAKQEYKRRLDLCIEVIEGCGLTLDDVEPAIRVTKDFYEEHKDFVEYIVKTIGKPALIEMWGERVFYFVLKYEFNFVDALSKASCLSTDQIDVENGERYDINYVDNDGVKKHPLILHCSPSGAIERVIYALLEKAHLVKEQGGVPCLPMWLSPTQVRIIPVSEDQLEYAMKVADEIESGGIRVDVDDRDATVGLKIRDAGQEWIPRVVVVGENEVKSKKLTVTIRELKEKKELSVKELVSEVLPQISGKPFRPIPLPRNISERPKFVG